MNIKYYIKTLLSSINPKSYRNLANRNIKDAFNFFFITLVISLILFLVLYIPSTLLFSNNLSQKLNEVDTFKIDADVSHNSPVELFRTPKVVLDLNGTKLSGQDVLISNNYIFYKKCMLFGEAKLDLNQISDLKNGNVKSLLATIMLLLIPTILVGLFIIFTVKNLALAIILTVLGYLFYRITLHQVKLRTLFKTAIYATGILLIADVLLILFFPMLWISIVLYVILFAFSSWWIAQKRFAIKKRKGQEFPDKKE